MMKKIPVPAVPMPSAQTEPNLKLCLEVMTHLEDHKAVNLVRIDLAGKSTLADFLLIASGTSGRHLRSLSEKVKEKLHQLGVKTVQVEGLESTDWVLIDGGDIIVHLFKPEIRDFYGLEKMWQTDLKPD